MDLNKAKFEYVYAEHVYVILGEVGGKHEKEIMSAAFNYSTK